MKMTKIALAIAGMLGATQAFAAAVTAADITTAQTAGTLQQTWLSGASAPTINIYDGFALGCDTGTMAIFTTEALSKTNVKPGSIGNASAYACKRSGVVSVMYHTLTGGSLNAYAPHTVGTLLDRIKYVGTGNGCTGNLTYGTIPVYKGCAAATGAQAADVAFDIAPRKPAGGFSDVEAALFASSIGGGDVSAFGSEAQANIGQVFGLAVSTNLYRELQVKQGIYASVAAANTADAAFNPTNAPNITSAQYVSIIAQGGAYQTDWSPILGTAGTGKKVVLARRVETSGTQASSNAFFLKTPCTDAVVANLNPATAADSSASFEVAEGSSTGNVKTRLSLANLQGDFAIGVVSTENDWRTEAVPASLTVAAPGSHQYRYVKLDGVHPEAGSNGLAGYPATNSNGTTFYTARNTAVSADYKFHMEMRSFVASTADTFGAALIPEISLALGNPTTCTDVPRGLTVNPLGGSSCTVGVEVHKGTVLGNNCSPYQLFQ